MKKRPFTRKGRGRIYVAKEEDIRKVEVIIRDMDAFEWEYLPDRFIVPFKCYPQTVFTGKFDTLCMDEITAACWKREIPVFCYEEEVEN